jgi:succinoglycan biosynthesis transport protein ExoP
MSPIQIARILWAYRLLILLAALSCFVGGLVVIKMLPPRWEGHSRVMLGLVKPDPVTGEVLATGAVRAYAATQVELIKDYSVAGQVVDQLGWLSDPVLIESYQNRSKTDTRDFRRFLAQRIIDGTKADLIEGSNILEITFDATNARDAKLVADALRKSYIDADLESRRAEANRNAEWFETQADKAKAQLATAQDAKAAYEKNNGIFLQDDKSDIESSRLKALSGQGAAPAPIILQASVTPAANELAQLDLQIAQASETLGNNNPELQAMRARRVGLATQAAQEKAANKAQQNAAMANYSALNQAVETQKSKVIAQGDKIQALRQLQTEVDLRTDQFNKSLARAAEYRQQAAVVDTGLTPLDSAVVPDRPVFPKKPLIMGGALCLGMGMGVMVSLLLELFARRVRGVEDMGAVHVPLMAVIPPARKIRKSPLRWFSDVTGWNELRGRTAT